MGDHMVEANGARIPTIGLGTLGLKGADCINAVKAALLMGYRHIDTAERYGNETDVGQGLDQGLAAAGLARDEVFVTTKVYQDKLAAADFARSFAQSLEKLQLSHVDLLLIHWPNPKIPLAETIGALCKVKRDGGATHIGVANFTTALIDEAVSLASEPLVTNQIEVHPFLDQTKVIEACRRHGMSVTAYCPLARGKVPGNPVLERIGTAHGRSAAQVSLRYLVQLGLVCIPKTAKSDHMAANLDVFDFALNDAEMAEVAALGRADGRVVNPAHAPVWDQ
jgi:diketogulonate reductase-like aldo/keto reductase